jgi:hypothetical protein
VINFVNFSFALFTPPLGDFHKASSLMAEGASGAAEGTSGSGEGASGWAEASSGSGASSILTDG